MFSLSLLLASLHSARYDLMMSSSSLCSSLNCYLTLLLLLWLSLAGYSCLEQSPLTFEEQQHTTGLRLVWLALFSGCSASSQSHVFLALTSTGFTQFPSRAAGLLAEYLLLRLICLLSTAATEPSCRLALVYHSLAHPVCSSLGRCFLVMYYRSLVFRKARRGYRSYTVHHFAFAVLVAGFVSPATLTVRLSAQLLKSSHAVRVSDRTAV